MHDFKREDRLLPVKLTQDEFDSFTAKLVSLDRKIDSLEDEKKEVSRKITNNIKETKREKNVVRRIVEDRVETRDVRCEFRPDYKNHVMNVFRLDTEERVEQRGLTKSEIQLSLDIEKEKKENSKKKKTKKSKKNENENNEVDDTNVTKLTFGESA